MKRIYFLGMMLALTLAVHAQTKQLLVLHTNDTHSTVYPLNSLLADTTVAGRGGFMRRIAMLKEERQRNPDLLYFDSGDFSQGSSFYSMFKGDVEVELMNRMGVDAATIGNHEFDYGLENMARLFRMANFPIVCSNYDFTGTPCEGLVKDYIILKRKGLKIGVFGLCPAMDGLVSADNCKGVIYRDPVAEARRVVALLKKKCDAIICISHLGWQLPNNDVDDERLVKATSGIDLVLGGHSHTYMNTVEQVANADGKLIPVDQNGKHGIFIGRLVMDFKKK